MASIAMSTAGPCAAFWATTATARISGGRPTRSPTAVTRNSRSGSAPRQVWAGVGRWFAQQRPGPRDDGVYHTICSKSYGPSAPADRSSSHVIGQIGREEFDDFSTIGPTRSRAAQSPAREAPSTKAGASRWAASLRTHPVRPAAHCLDRHDDPRPSVGTAGLDGFASALHAKNDANDALHLIEPLRVQVVGHP